MSELRLVFREDGRSVYRFSGQSSVHAPARSELPCPSIRSDAIAPCMGPDGKLHDSLSGYRASLRPDGNPQGERYTEVGNEKIEYQAPKIDKKKRREHIKQALSDVKNGNVNLSDG